MIVTNHHVLGKVPRLMSGMKNQLQARGNAVSSRVCKQAHGDSRKNRISPCLGLVASRKVRACGG